VHRFAIASDPDREAMHATRSRLRSSRVAASPERILLIRPSSLGDVARSVPAAASLRLAFPAARIDWLVEQGFEAVVSHHPAVSNVVTFPKKRIRDALRRLDPRPLIAFARTLRASNYDCVLDLQGLARSAAMTWLTRAPRRIGLADARELGWLAYTTRAPAGADMHAVERMLAVVAAAGARPVADMRLYVPPKGREWLATQAWAARPYVVLAPTSRWPAKQWPAARFASVAQAARARDLTVAVVGGRSERAQCEAVTSLAAEDAGIIDLVGVTDVAGLMAVIEGSRAVVANDSAALHLAVGLGRPTVALFGPTRADRVGPFGRSHEVIQHVAAWESLDHKRASGVRLMERIEATEVIEALRRVVARG
jgi:lipopolysaccharide heptosyltransferase I